MKINDNKQRLKTYKIKNHNSGKTYSVKAVSYTDAVNRYNKHILKDSWSSYRFKTGPQSDEFKRYLRSRRIYFEPSQDGAYTHFEVKNADEEVDRKANEIVKQIKDALTEDAYVYSTNASTSMALSFAKQCVEKFGGKVATRNGNKYVYVAPNRDIAEKAKRFLETEYSSMLPSVKFIVSDTLTDDEDLGYVFEVKQGHQYAYIFAKTVKEAKQEYERITGKQAQYVEKRSQKKISRNSVKNTCINIKDSLTNDTYIAQIDDSLTEDSESSSEREARLHWKNFKIGTRVRHKKHGLGTVIDRKGERLYVEFDKGGIGQYYHNSDLELVEDSLTEDDKNDFTYKGYTVLAEYQLGHYTVPKNIVQYRIYEPNGNYLFAVKTAEQAKRAIDFEIKNRIKDSLTEDADIAQNDIKSTYLPEDANADNIRYLGFNEKRKLSFYAYGDRYFVYHDLEGRTEEIDKETVQKILKKNIFGEIDENDLINKEPQSEEIVTDWKKKQESGDR